jgi:hypothetical protein
MITSIELLIIMVVLTIFLDGTRSKFDFFAKLALIAFTVATGVHIAQNELI